MDDEISTQLFCHSLDSWLRLLLRLVKVLLEFGLSSWGLRLAATSRDCRQSVGLADLGMDQMVLSTSQLLSVVFFRVFCEFSEGWVCHLEGCATMIS